MKKMLAVVAAVVAMVMLLSTCTYAAELGSNAGISLEKYGQKTYFVGPATDSAPVVDGVIDEGEYTYSVKLEDAALWMTNTSLNQKAESAPEEDWMGSDSITYYYSYDEDYIYLAFYDVQGYKDENNWIFRSNYVFRLGFNLDDFSEYIQFKLVANHGDYTNVAESPSIGMTNASGNTPLSDEEKTIVAAYATKVTAEELPEGSEITYMDAQPWIRQFEVMFSKEKILEAINFYCGTEYAELPNAMTIAHGVKSYREYAPKAVADDALRVYAMWNCAELDDAAKAELGVEFNYVPNVVVFGDKLETPKFKGEEPEETEPEETEPEETEDVGGNEAEVTEGGAEQTNAAGGDDKAEKGCGSFVGVPAMALISAAAALAYVESKKRK